MNTLKKYLVLTILAIPILVTGQPDFKELYKSLSENDRFSNMISLREYQQKVPEQAIVYYLLGDLYFSYIYETNPLTMLDFIEMNYRELKTNYGLAKLNLDEQQARRDREYFGQIAITTNKKTITYPDIIIEIDKRLASSEIYYYNAVNVHDNYVKCIEKYNQCLFRFRDILRNYPNYKELYLLLTDELKNEIKGIAVDFDSALVYFDSYKSSCEKLPHLLKVNQYQLKPITTYRLEGLVEADFTLPVVELWDFKSWVSEFLRTVDGDIAQVRKQMITVDDQLNSQISKLAEELYGDELNAFKPDDKFLNLIGKYDYSSIARQLFEYKKSKIDFLLSTRKTINNPGDSTQEYFINRLRYFKDLAFEERKLNDKADELNKAITLGAIEKYIEFFDSRYKGLDGFTRWCEVEKYGNETILTQNLRHIFLFHERERLEKYKVDTLLYWGKKPLTVGVQSPSFDTLWADTMFTLQQVKVKSKNYLSGIIYSKNKSISSFLAQIDGYEKVGWLNETKYPITDTVKSIEPLHLSLLSDSCCFTLNHLVVAKNSQKQEYNYLEKTDLKGKKLQLVKFERGEYPRYFYVDELNEKLLMVTHGPGKNEAEASGDSLIVTLMDFDGKKIWERSFWLVGNFVDVVHTNSNFFVFCNASSFTTSNGSVGFSARKPGSSDMVGIYITSEGNVEALYDYFSTNSLNISIAQKITSNLLTFAGNNSGIKGTGELFYLLTDQDGKPVFSTDKSIDYKKVEF